MSGYVDSYIGGCVHIESKTVVVKWCCPHGKSNYVINCYYNFYGDDGDFRKTPVANLYLEIWADAVNRLITKNRSDSSSHVTGFSSIRA